MFENILDLVGDLCYGECVYKKGDDFYDFQFFVEYVVRVFRSGCVNLVYMLLSYVIYFDIYYQNIQKWEGNC